MKPIEGLRLLPSMLIALGGATLRGLKGRSAWAKYDPKEPHWHLDPLAVAPEMQGQGIGSQLLKYFCDQVDETGRAAYLETDRAENVRLYERFGWSVREEASTLGVHVWFMWRTAREKAS
jgi:GNAT superfamily N-acetyltransferase